MTVKSALPNSDSLSLQVTEVTELKEISNRHIYIVSKTPSKMIKTNKTQNFLLLL